MTEVSAGQKILAAHNNDLHNRIIWVVKAVDESVTSSITVQDDDELSLTLPANGTYRVQLDVSASGDPASDLRSAWNAPSGVTCLSRIRQGLGSSATTLDNQSVRNLNTTDLTSELGAGTPSTSAPVPYQEVLYLTTGVSDATLTYRWAQATSGATATVVEAGSAIVVMRLLS